MLRSVVFSVYEIDQFRQDNSPPWFPFRREQSTSKGAGDFMDALLLRGERVQDLLSVIRLLLRGELGQPAHEGRGWMQRSGVDRQRDPAPAPVHGAEE